MDCNAGSRPRAKGSGGGGVVSKKLFWGLKIGGKGLPDPSPGSATGLAQTLAKTRFLLLKETSSGRKIK